jgi:hypothetical protein
MDVGARKAGTEAGYEGWEGFITRAATVFVKVEERCTNQTVAPDALLQNRHDLRNGRAPAIVLTFLILWRVEQRVA